MRTRRIDGASTSDATAFSPSNVFRNQPEPSLSEYTEGAVSSEYAMRVTAGGVSHVVTLFSTATARAIWNALPLESRASRWGDELYFSVPVDLAEEQSLEVASVGDVAYWPPGTSVCIFWGPTPASTGSEPRAASPVNVFGHISEGAADFDAVKSGATLKLERA